MSSPTPLRNWYLWLLFAGLFLLGAAGVLLGASVSGLVDGEDGPGAVEFNVGLSDDRTSTGFTLPTPSAATPAAPTPAPPRAPIVRVLIPKANVDAPVETVSVTPEGVMEAPGGPEQVGWYEFSGFPGFGGNAVFSGHVDYHDYGRAVFWYLSDLRPGDEVVVVLEDGTSYTYGVVSANSYSADEAPIEDIVGATARESVTLITCTGSFDSSVRQYDQRLVIRAERV